MLLCIFSYCQSKKYDFLGHVARKNTGEKAHDMEVTEAFP
jgi:hypothetical protein